MKLVRVGSNVTIGGGDIVLLAGPCVLEGYERSLRIGRATKSICDKLGVQYIFKASFDKANRSSFDSFRGPGLKEGLEIMKTIKRDLGVPVVSDIHESQQAATAAEVLDILQIPAFLSRQTDLVHACGATGKVVNVKKGQFMAPLDMKNVVNKLLESGNDNILLTDRGASFGYNTLVSDFRALPQMRSLGYPVVFDATHSVQQPGGLGTTSGGQREFVPCLARAAAAVGVDAIFMEVHDNPAEGLSDAANMLPLDELELLLRDIIEINCIVRKYK